MNKINKKVLYAIAIVLLIAVGVWTFRPVNDTTQRVKKSSSSKPESLINKTIKKANDAIAKGDIKEAEEALAELKKTDPDNPAVDKLAAQVASADSSETDTTSTSDNTKSAKPEGKLDADDATPLSILPAKLDGYSVSNGWLKKPTLAGATYEPKDGNKAVDRIFLTVSETTVKKASSKLDKEKKKYSLNSKDIKLEGATTYSGIYGGIYSVTWKDGRWWFSMQVLPGTEPTDDALKSTAQDIINKLGV